MKILFLTRVLPVHASGGMQQHAETVINFLKKKSELTVVTTAHPESVKEDKDGSIRTIYLEKTLPGKYYGGWWKQSGIILREILEKDSFDVILSESVAAYSFFKYRLNEKFNIPVFAFCPGYFPKEIRTTLRKGMSLKLPFSVIYKIINYVFIDVKFYPRLTAVFAKSGEIMDYFRKRYPELETRVIYNGIDTDEFAPREKDKALFSRYGLADDDIVLLNVGRLEKEKGIINLLDGFQLLTEKHPGLKLLVAGDGSYESRIREKINRSEVLKEKVRLLGRVRHSDLPGLYNLADIFVFPSLCDEGLPHVILEALASGLPVVSTVYPGIEDIIEDGKDGLLYPKNDVEKLEEKIDLLIKSPDLLKTMKIECRRKADDRFSLARIGEEIEKIIREFLDEQSKSA